MQSTLKVLHRYEEKKQCVATLEVENVKISLYQFSRIRGIMKWVQITWTVAEVTFMDIWNNLNFRMWNGKQCTETAGNKKLKV